MALINLELYFYSNIRRYIICEYIDKKVQEMGKSSNDGFYADFFSDST